jgi:kumamolisin
MANYRQLPGSESTPAPGARALGASDENEKLSVTIVLRRRSAGPPVPGPEHYRETPPAQRPRLSEAEFAARYGADPAEMDKVTAFARREGLSVDETNAARRTVVVAGTVAQFNKAFDISLHNYEHEVERSPRSGRQTETYRGYDGFIHVPTDLAEVIVGVFGLDNRRISKPTGGFDHLLRQSCSNFLAKHAPTADYGLDRSVIRGMPDNMDQKE